MLLGARTMLCCSHCSWLSKILIDIDETESDVTILVHEQYRLQNIVQAFLNIIVQDLIIDHDFIPYTDNDLGFMHENNLPSPVRAAFKY